MLVVAAIYRVGLRNDGSETHTTCGVLQPRLVSLVPYPKGVKIGSLRHIAIGC